MAAIAQLKAMLGIDNKDFKAGVKGSAAAADGFQKKLVSIGQSMGMAFSAGAIIAFTKEIIGAAAKLETLETQFINLGGSAEQAANQMKAIRAFAAETPMSVEDISKASQQLLVFSEGALGGIDSLRLFGDMVSATGEDFETVAYWVGRFYAALKSGQPIERSIQALARLKGIGPSTLKELKDMRDAGATGTEIWDAYTESLKKFEGALERSSKTAAGQLSTLADNVRDLKAALGELLEPGTKAGAGGLTKFIQNFMQAGSFKGYARALVDPTYIGKWYERMFSGQVHREHELGGETGEGLGRGTEMEEAPTGITGAAMSAAFAPTKKAIDEGRKRGAEEMKKWLAAQKARLASFDKFDAGVTQLAEGISTAREGARGKIRSDSMASVGIHAGPGRSGLTIQDRQLKVQIESRRLQSESVEYLRGIYDSTDHGGGE